MSEIEEREIIESFIKASKILSEANVPSEGRFAWVHPMVMAWLRKGKFKLMLRGTYLHNGCNIKWRSKH